MRSFKGYGLRSARAIVVMMSPSMRSPLRKHREACNDKAARRRELVAKLQEMGLFGVSCGCPQGLVTRPARLGTLFGTVFYK